MQVHWGTFGRLLLVAPLVGLLGCPPPAPPEVAKPAYTPGNKVWAVLPAESDAFPIAARETTERLRRARLAGQAEPQVSKVSLEVVQLSIECVEHTATCFTAVGKSVGANEILFAQLEEGPKKQSIKVTVTLFDVDAGKRTKAAIKVFPSEEDVAWGVADVVAEATKP